MFHRIIDCGTHFSIWDNTTIWFWIISHCFTNCNSKQNSLLLQWRNEEVMPQIWNLVCHTQKPMGLLCNSLPTEVVGALVWGWSLINLQRGLYNRVGFNSRGLNSMTQDVPSCPVFLCSLIPRGIMLYHASCTCTLPELAGQHNITHSRGRIMATILPKADTTHQAVDLQPCPIPTPCTHIAQATAFVAPIDHNDPKSQIRP